jgi:ABC-2 type transport system permease protein
VSAKPITATAPGARRRERLVDPLAVRAVLRRDLRALRRSNAMLIPMLAVPFVLLVILPASVGFAAQAGTFDVSRLLELLPTGLTESVLAHPEQERLVILVLGYLVAPLFLIVPLMVSAVLAGDAFAGEKERKTLETILHLPVRARDLYVAKLLGAYLPALAVAWVGFAMYVAMSNLVCWPVMGRIFLPTALWMIVIAWIAPAVAAVGLGIMVRVSIRVNNTQEAQQLGGAVVLPLVVLAVAQTTQLLLSSPVTALLVGAAVWVVAIWLNVRGAHHFTRERMASRL